MPWCPECQVEYRKGIERCSECQVALVAALPVEEPRKAPTGVEIKVFPSREEAELALGCLRSAGIQGEIRDPDPARHEVQPGSATVFLAVEPQHLVHALQLLEAAERGEVAVNESDSPEM